MQSHLSPKTKTTITAIIPVPPCREIHVVLLPTYLIFLRSYNRQVNTLTDGPQETYYRATKPYSP